MKEKITENDEMELLKSLKSNQAHFYSLMISSGEDQYNQVIEECSEVIKEITKRNRGKSDEASLREELGDLMNAIESIIFIKSWNRDRFDKDRLEKLRRYANKCAQ